MERPDMHFIDQIDSKRLGVVCAAVLTWLDEAGERDRAKVLEALQIKVEATRDEARISGVIPSDAPEFITIERTSAL